MAKATKPSKLKLSASQKNLFLLIIVKCRIQLKDNDPQEKNLLKIDILVIFGFYHLCLDR